VIVPAAPNDRFAEVLNSLRHAAIPSHALTTEIPAPTRIAPFAVALEAKVPGGERPLATGSFIVLHDPDPPSAWQGDVRVICATKAEVESEMAEDPLFSEVVWTWLTEALDTAGPLPCALAGTVTKTMDESFGGLRPRGTHVAVEVRASWTPEGADAGDHLVAWLTFLGRLGGLEPLPTDVPRLPARV